MGIIRQGVLGGFRKKTGSVVGAYFRKLDIIRGLPRISNKPATQAQIDHRSKFGMVTSFLSRLSDLIDVYYKKGNGSTSPMNEAVSYHLKETIIGTAPDFKIDFQKLRFSSGKLSIPTIYDVEAVAGAEIKFTWTQDGADGKYKDGTDMINVLVYEATADRIVSLLLAAPRSAREFSLQLPPDMVGAEVYCYFCFSSVKKKRMNSDSIYVKLLEVV